MKFIKQIQWPALFSFILMILGCQSSPAKKIDRDPAVAKDPFLTVQTHYFPMLNLHADANRIQSLPKFAAHLSALADLERSKLADKLLTTNAAQERAGLIFIYDGLMTLNNITAVTSGVVPLNQMTAARRFGSDDTSEQDELIARFNYLIEEFMVAAQLRPDDRRIDSWIAASKRGLDQFQNGGQPSQDALEGVLDAIAIRPTFNLWSAILVFKSQNADTPLFERLTSASKYFVDGVSQGINPCTDRPQDCGNGVHAPYNYQAGAIELGDVFLRRAEALFNQEEIPEAMEMLAYAKGTYAQMNQPAHAAQTKSWPDHAALNDRAEWITKLQQVPRLPNGTIANSSSFKLVHECATCHGR